MQKIGCRVKQFPERSGLGLAGYKKVGTFLWYLLRAVSYPVGSGALQVRCRWVGTGNVANVREV